MTHAASAAFWRKQDWTLPDCDLAFFTARKPCVVRYWRKMLRKPASVRNGRRGPHGPSKWTPERLAEIVGRGTRELMDEFGVTRQRVHQLRAMACRTATK